MYPIFFNLYIKNGNSSKEELLKHLGNGVYIDILNGLRVGCNVTSGEFSLGAEGFAVENGNLTKALNQFTIAGNIFDLLQNIEMLGNDLDLSKSSCVWRFSAMTRAIVVPQLPDPMIPTRFIAK